MSHTQLQTLATCGEQYRLERAFGLRGGAGWALVGGKTLHRGTEVIDLALEGVGLTDSDGLVEFLPSQNSDRDVSDQPESADEVEPSQADKMVAELQSKLHQLEREIGVLAPLLASRDPGPEEEPDPVEPEEDPEPESDDDSPVKKKRRAAVPLEKKLPEGSDEAKALWGACFDFEIHSQLLSDWKALQKQYPGEIPDGIDLPDPKDWKASGKESKTWPKKEDRSWWNRFGPSMLEKWIRFRHKGWRIAYTGDQPAIELDVSGILPGGQFGEDSFNDMQVQAYLDRVMINPSAAVVLLDIKSNAQLPTDPEQLGLYALLLQLSGKPRPDYGAYWGARKGDVGDIYDLSMYTLEYFQWKYGHLKDLRDRGVLLANTKSQFCNGCSVAEYCFVKRGDKANRIPRPWTPEGRVSVRGPYEKSGRAAPTSAA